MNNLGRVEQLMRFRRTKCVFVTLLLFCLLLAHQLLAKTSGKWERIFPSPDLDRFSSVAKSENLYVAVGDAGLVKTSEDGIIWALQDFPSFQDISSVIWAGTQFIAVGERGGILVTSDGKIWEEKNSGINFWLRDVTWTGNQYVAVGDSGSIVTSQTGESWILRSSPLTEGREDLASVSFENGLLIILSESGKIMTSSNGVDWVVKYDGNGRYKDVIWFESEYLAIGPSYDLLRSEDGDTWTEESPVLRRSMNGIISNSQQLVVVGEGEIYSSADGVIWDLRLSGSGDYWTMGIWTGQRFIAYSLSGQIASSTDGIDWAFETNYTSFLFDVAYGNGTYVGIEQGVVTSPDGVQWTSQTPGFARNSGFGDGLDLDWFEDRFILPDGLNIHSSADGVVWETLSPWVDGRPISKGITSIERGGGIYVAVGRRGALYSTSSDLSVWEQHRSPTTEDLVDVKWLGDQFVAVGKSGTILTSGNGTQWIKRVSDSFFDLSEVAYSGEVYVVVGQAHILVSTDGIQWALAHPPIFPALLGSVVWTGSEFLVGGASGVIFSSTNGTDWIQRPLPTDGGVTVRMTDNGKLLVNGRQGFLQSENGINWSLQSGMTDTKLYGISYRNNQYIAVGLDGIMLKSIDGITWSSMVRKTEESLSDVKITENGWIAVGGRGVILTSENGEEWDLQKLPTEPSFLGVCFGNEKYVAVGSQGIFVSQDGVAWDARPTDTSVLINDVIWTGTQFVAVGDSSTILTSPGGDVWTLRQPQLSNLALRKVASSGSQIIAAGSDGRALSSDDGITWTTIDTGTSEDFREVVWTGKEFVLLGGSLAIHLSGSEVVISKLPTGGRNLFAAVWSGNEMMAVGGKEFFSDLPGGILLRYSYPLSAAYLAWAESSGLPNGFDAPEDDPNEDGISNLLAFGLGLNPLIPLSKVDLDSIPKADGEIPFSMSFSLPSDRISDVIYVIEQSDLLGPSHWREVARKSPNSLWSGEVSVAEDPPQGGRMRVVMTYPSNTETKEKKFFRLRVDFP